MNTTKLIATASIASSLLGIACVGLWSASEPATPRARPAAHAGHGSDASVIARCADSPDEGFVAKLRSADLVALGRAGQMESTWVDGWLEYRVQIAGVLAGERPDDSVAALAAPHTPMIPIDADGLFFMHKDNGTLHVETWLPLGRDDEARVESLIQDLEGLVAGSRAPETLARAGRALAQATRAGDERVRHMALIDLNGDAELIAALDDSSVRQLRRLARRLPGNDKGIIDVIEILGVRPDAANTDAIVSTLGNAHADRLMPVLQRVLARQPHAAAAHLAARLEDSRRAVSRRASHLLARIDDPEARAHLLPYMAPKSDPDLQAGALIAHAGTDDLSARSIGRDVIRRHTELNADAASPIGRVLAARKLAEARETFTQGERLRLMAAGYLLARSPDARDREWLATRLSRLDDPVAAKFIGTRLTNPWTDFDRAW